MVLLLMLLPVLSVNSYAQECTRFKPMVTLSPTNVGGPGDTTFLFTATIRNEDQQLCGASQFTVSPSLPAVWTSFIHPQTISVFPGQSEIISMDITVPKGATAQEHQAIFVVSSPNHNTPDLKNTQTALVTIRQEAKECTVSVDEIVFRKAGTDVEKITFCTKEKADVDAKISLRGNTKGQVNVDLLLGGKQIDSKTVTIFPDNFASINFNSAIDTQVMGKSTQNVKVVAKADCSAKEATREKQFQIDICDPSCLFTTSVALPTQKTAGEDLITSMYTRNIGNKENLIAVEQALCKGEECIPMVCDATSFKLQSEESKTYSCKQKVKQEGSYVVETKLFSCGKEETLTNHFVGLTSSTSTTGSVISEQECKVQGLAEYRCSGSIRQQLFRNSDCSTTWVYQQYCPDGCEKGLCISTGEPIRGFEPVVNMEESSEAKVGSDYVLNMEVENTLGSPAKFDIEVTGPASGWISIPSSIIVGERDKDAIAFSVVVPEDAIPGEYEFTVTISTGTRSVSKTSLIRIAEEEKPAMTIELVLASVLALVLAFITIKFFQSRKQKF